MTQPPQPPPPGHQPAQIPGQVPAQPPTGANGTLVLHLQGNFMTSMITPAVRLNGQELPVRYGVNNFPVVPGTHLLEGNAKWMWTYGQASQQVVIAPGQSTEVWYAAPVLTFLKGRMGPTKQRIPGLIAMLVFVGLMFAFMFAVFFLAAAYN